MLYLVLGNDRDKKRTTISDIVGNNKVVHLTGGENTLSFLASEFLQATFFTDQDTTVFVVHGVLECSGIENFLIHHGQELLDSEKKLIFQDEVLLRSKITLFEKAGAHISYCDISSAKAKELSVFTLCDAVATGSKKNAWKCLQELLDAGIDPQEYVAPLLWWCKGVVLEKNGIKNPKPFVQKKFQKAVVLFGPTIEGRLVELLEVLDTLRNGANLLSELEGWIIKTCPN